METTNEVKNPGVALIEGILARRKTLKTGKEAVGIAHKRLESRLNAFDADGEFVPMLERATERSEKDGQWVYKLNVDAVYRAFGGKDFPEFDGQKAFARAVLAFSRQQAIGWATLAAAKHGVTVTLPNDRETAIACLEAMSTFFKIGDRLAPSAKEIDRRYATGPGSVVDRLAAMFAGE